MSKYQNKSEYIAIALSLLSFSLVAGYIVGSSVSNGIMSERGNKTIR
jgi:hypothetical protein